MKLNDAKEKPLHGDRVRDTETGCHNMNVASCVERSNDPTVIFSVLLLVFSVYTFNRQLPQLSV